MTATTVRRRRHAWLAVPAAVIAAATLTACGSSGASTSPPTSGSSHRVTITGNDMLRFDPATVQLPTGASTITLVNSGAYPHNIRIPGIGYTSSTVTGNPGGQTVSFTVTFAHPGRYRFYCVYHESAGMVGTFVVSG